MTDTTATYEVVRTALGAEQYRASIEITETTNDLSTALFVFDTATDTYVSVATLYTLEAAPVGKQAAIDAGADYYRGPMVLRDFESVPLAEMFVDATTRRIGYLCRTIDRVAVPYTGSDTGVAPGIYLSGAVQGEGGDTIEPITIKAGDTLTLPMRWSIDGVPVDITGFDITCQTRLRGAAPGDPPVADLLCTINPDQVTLDTRGRFVASATAGETLLWPVATLICDVRLANGGDVVHTKSFEIVVRQAVTQ